MLSSLVVTIAFTGGFHVGRCVNVVSFSRANVPVPSRTDGFGQLTSLVAGRSWVVVVQQVGWLRVMEINSVTDGMILSPLSLG